MAEVLLGIVGDVLVNRDNPPEVFGKVREVLRLPDILFGNLEGAHTDAPPKAGELSMVSASLRNLEAYASAGFSVMSLANNHVLDLGAEAMLVTRERLRSLGIGTCGAGSNLTDARAPAILEAHGIRVAFLAYASVFAVGREATASTPGLAPMRAYNRWRDPFPAYHAPGMRPIVTTVPDRDDLARLSEDILDARVDSDLVVVSFHWGDYTCPFHLTDHEVRTARFCVDEGAHMVIGHHHHALRGMEWYRGKPIMYGLGHFVFDYRSGQTDEELTRKLRESELAGYFALSPYAPGVRPGWPLLPMHEDMRLTVLGWAIADKNGISAIGFLPCKLNAEGVVQPASPGSPGGDDVVRYLERCNASQGLNGRITSERAAAMAGYQTFRVVPGDARAHDV